MPPKLFEGWPGPKVVQNKGSVHALPGGVQPFVRHWIHVCKPGGVYICDGSAKEADDVINPWVTAGIVTRLGRNKSCYLFRSDPRDTGSALLSKTYFCAPNIEEWFSSDKMGVGLWKSSDDMKEQMDERFTHCMTGRTMYVFPFCLGPLEYRHRKLGVMLTDSPFVYFTMRTEVRVSSSVWKLLQKTDLSIKCIHSVGRPRPDRELVKYHWPCNPEKVLLAYYPEDKRIKTYGSGVLDPSTFLFPFINVTARREGWVVSNMTILGITVPNGKEFFVAMAFTKGCGVSTMVKLGTSLPGYCVRTIGSGMAWMWTDERGVLRALNPMVGFSGNATGVNEANNPDLMQALQTNAIFLNTAVTGDGAFYWKGLENDTLKEAQITDWRGLPWNPEQGSAHVSAAHPDCRYFFPATKYPSLHPRWNDWEGVPITAIIFGEKRSRAVPLVYECKSWEHGVLAGACLKSEVVPDTQTSTGSSVVHDPMATHGCVVDNTMGLYLQQWLDMDVDTGQKARFFHVNWFQQVGDDGHVVWPGMEENLRVVDWILRCCDNQENVSVPCPLGYIPRHGSMNMKGMEFIEMDQLLAVPKHFWLEEIREARDYLNQQLGTDTSHVLLRLLNEIKTEFHELPDHERPCEPCCHGYPGRCYACLGPPTKYGTCPCSK